MRFTLGVDEAGRGPLAGPAAVGVVMVSRGFDVAREFPGVKDSKKLSEGKRERLMRQLEARATQGDVWYRVELENAEAIDEEGIAVVIRRAITRGVTALASETGHPMSSFEILLDGGLTAPAEYQQETIIRGDDLVPLISLASIAAKVTCDRLMVDLSREYPQYGFDRHKGYGTALHYAQLSEHGLCAIHRRSFIHLANLDKEE